MANELSPTAAKVARVHPEQDEVYSYITGVAVTAGEAVYEATTGKLALADANGSAVTYQFRGIALQTRAAGQAVPVLKRGMLYGMGADALNGGAALYLSDTAGDIATTAGSTTVIVGCVTSLADADLTKVVYIDANWATVWS